MILFEVILKSDRNGCGHSWGGISMNVLVCDDDKEIVDAIGIYLENEGYQIFKVFNGLEAIDIIKKHEIHLIIMDIMMPMMDGLRATMKIREENNIPLI